MRLIDADDLINTLGISDNDIYCKETIEEYILDNGTLSFTEPERKKGKWLRSGSAIFPCECDQCGDTTERNTPFCPHCGSYNGGKNEV